jgi:hypothetical protein
MTIDDDMPADEEWEFDEEEVKAKFLDRTRDNNTENEKIDPFDFSSEYSGTLEPMIQALIETASHIGIPLVVFGILSSDEEGNARGFTSTSRDVNTRFGTLHRLLVKAISDTIPMQFIATVFDAAYDLNSYLRHVQREYEEYIRSTLGNMRDSRDEE